ncbi:MAG TPA: NIPSNAP family protein, partial [Lacipirellulaceae bacterium]|nr:NIPSNAP family protein [Lacipirellulaceae bacterium]
SRTASAQESAGPRQFFEWRTYRLASAQKRPIFDEYLRTAALPAWGRMGLGPVGVFQEIGADASPAVRVLLVHPTLELLAEERSLLERDGEYQAHAAEYLAAAKDDPVFTRIDSWLLRAFAGAPQLTPPANSPRVYEMRTYESHTEERARKKIAMFDKYEIALFPQCGFQNVFFGETLVGPGLPALKYMLAAPDMAANEAGWQRFINHPDWLAVKDDPEYRDTVSKMHKLFLEPTEYSQI